MALCIAGWGNKSLNGSAWSLQPASRLSVVVEVDEKGGCLVDSAREFRYGREADT